MLSDPHLVVTEFLGQLEEAKILIEALHHAGEIRHLAQAEDPKLRLDHAGSSPAVAQVHPAEPWAGRQTCDRTPAIRQRRDGLTRSRAVLGRIVRACS